jgi:hypothetical protein
MAEEDVNAIEEYVAACQARQPTHKSRQQDGTDVVEVGMKVPVSVLDEYSDSFQAADEKRKNASTKFFGCMGLMALLCQHDHVLWIIGMTHAGEH